MAPNPTTRMLTTREVLRLVFEYCDRRDNGRNALVSKNWSNEALPFVWSSIETLRPLLNLLAPLDVVTDATGERKYRFRRPIRPACWVVFLKYSRHVHEIKSMREKFCDSVFTYIASSRPVIELLPNLRRLNYMNGPESFLPVFLHLKLTQLRLSIDFLDWDQRGTRWLISYLPDRAPNLEYLRLDATRSADAPPELGLDTVIGSLSRLRKLSTSSSLLTPSLLHALSLLPCLESLRVKFPMSVDIRPTKVAVPSFARDDGFPALKSLELESYSFEVVAPILELYRLDHLVHLSVDSFAREPVGEYVNIFSIASTYCPRLQSLELESLPQATKQPIDPTIFFQPLCRCSSLTALTLSNPVPLCLDTKTLIAIVTSLPFLHTLCLEEQSTVPPTLPLSSLVELAPRCPRLERLTLYMDTFLCPPCTTEEHHFEPFKALKILSVGTSPFRSSLKAVTAFLIGVLPRHCNLHHTFDYDNDDELASVNSERWFRAAEILSRATNISTVE
ncbi:hypothetical protein BDN71DRAFT_1592567 [Pleurotus eryngii]|uniref:F-box domain-containing protein n=1 Tax=Pleurotus eryngii TaxID=5323 RepID=A0A9P5ZQQ8_PLEER|nr:hypothetical protein BDN71DRAFT_1592567 [Pleurotus eryngii]